MGVDISTYRSSRPKTAVKKEGKVTKLLELELNKGFSNKNKVEFYKEFATLLNSGVDFRQALDILKISKRKRYTRNLLQILPSR